VRITRAFYIGRFEVTQGQWQAVMGNNPSHFKGDERLPVETVSWDDCQEFLRKAGDGLRLPTEAHWEYACRAGSVGAFCFGDNEVALGGYGWYSDNSNRETHLVGQKRLNAWGVCDMHGNVWEWCHDWYGPYGSGGADDPQGPSTGARRVLRGAAWNSWASRCRSASRVGVAPGEAGQSNGFRVALSPAQGVVP